MNLCQIDKSVLIWSKSKGISSAVPHDYVGLLVAFELFIINLFSVDALHYLNKLI